MPPIDSQWAGVIVSLVSAIGAIVASAVAVYSMRILKADFELRQRPFVHVPSPRSTVLGNVTRLEFTLVNSGILPASIRRITLEGIGESAGVEAQEHGNLIVYPGFRNVELFTIDTKPVAELELTIVYDPLGRAARGRFFFTQPMVLTLCETGAARGQHTSRYNVQYGREAAN